jgi:hypothetical protein
MSRHGIAINTTDAKTREFIMFEVIISVVRTGRVQRRLFDTHEAAARFAQRRLHAWLNPKPRDGQPSKPRSARDIRIEIQSRDVPAIRRLETATRSRVAVA